MTPHAFDPERRQGVYDAIATRRDVRSFRADPLSDDVLQRLLEAAHRAPSVGLMQPWDFIVVRDVEVRRRVQGLFAREKAAAVAFFDDPRRDQYLQLKLEGIVQSPVNVVVTCDPTRAGPEVLGRHSIPETDVYSTCLAVENLWLAARAEGVGVGWVSILRNAELREILGIPPHVITVAYLCVGYTDEFPDAPVLETVGWGSREALAGLVHYDAWGRKTPPPTSQGDGGSDLGRLLRAIARVGPLDATAAAEARERQAQLTKPPGSLGRLERLATQIAGITGKVRPRLEHRAVIMMAADHGAASEEAVSAYPPQVTAGHQKRSPTFFDSGHPSQGRRRRTPLSCRSVVAQGAMRFFLLARKERQESMAHAWAPTANGNRGRLVVGLVGLFMLYLLGLDQGFLLSVVQGQTALDQNLVHEFVHDARHAAAFPCH